MPTDDRAHWENAKMLTTEGERACGWKISYVRLQSWQKRKALFRTHIHKHSYTPGQPVWCKNWSRALVHNTHVHTHTHTFSLWGVLARREQRRDVRERKGKVNKREERERKKTKKWKVDRWRDWCTEKKEACISWQWPPAVSLCAHLLSFSFLPPSSIFFFQPLIFLSWASLTVSLLSVFLTLTNTLPFVLNVNLFIVILTDISSSSSWWHFRSHMRMKKGGKK